MRQILTVRNRQFKKTRQQFIAMVLCLVIPDLFGQSEMHGVTDPLWLNNTAPCAEASVERLLQQGFAEDWQTLEACENPRSLWWVLEIKPKVKHGKKTRKTALNADEGEVFFEFKSDFGTRLERVITERYTGPPKWMPPHLAYWDPYIGDWRYRRTNLNDHVYEQKAGTELVMFWIRYEHYEDGIIWDTSFDFNRLLEVFDMSLFRLNGLTSKVLHFIKTGTE